MAKLSSYRKKRDFGKTPEPAGAEPRRPAGNGGLFVVHKHEASRLHYDLRLEHDGVLESWAVPKGPGRRKGEKRLAVQVEDHPLEYGAFEGVIPAGEYGGGTVMLWDRGHWRETKRRDGQIDFELEGQKLQGAWTLTRMSSSDGRKENWLLIKRSDPGRTSTAPVPETMRDDRSVATGRTMSEIAASGETAGPPDAEFAVEDLPGARPGRVPATLRPQLATLADAPPRAEGWIHEIKFDGYRVMAALRDGEVRLVSRNGKDWTGRYPEIAAQLASLPTEQALLDGEVVSLHEDGSQRGVSRPSARPRGGVTRDPGTACVAGVALTHPDRVLYPEQGITKLTLAKYYEALADWILPTLRDRPLVLLRCPQGRGRHCFYQKYPGDAMAAELPRTSIHEKSRRAEYLHVQGLPHLIALVQAGGLELHAWGSRVDDLERPDTMVFDLDPGDDVAWREVLRTARELRDRLEALGLSAFVRTTGGKGLHLVVPLRPSASWGEAKEFARAVATAHAADDPGRLTTNMSRVRRQGGIFLDYLRNGRGATAIASYSTRARTGAPVAVPLRWDELNPRIESSHYSVAKVRRRLGSLRSDPWQGFREAARPLTAGMQNAVRAAGKRRR